MNGKEIICAWLEEHGYDGLYLPDPDQECGCLLEDLIPCENDPCFCEAGKKYLTEDGDWFIGKL